MMVPIATATPLAGSSVSRADLKAYIGTLPQSQAPAEYSSELDSFKGSTLGEVYANAHARERAEEKATILSVGGSMASGFASLTGLVVGLGGGPLVVAAPLLLVGMVGDLASGLAFMKHGTVAVETHDFCGQLTQWGKALAAPPAPQPTGAPAL